VTQLGAQDPEQRVLVLAPTRKDGELVCTLLEQDGIRCTACFDLPGLCAELAHGAAAVVLAEEAVVEPMITPLVRRLAEQPAWSDLPVLILTRHGADSPEAVRSLAMLGNVTLLERPARVASMVSAVRSALRARARQYQLRAQFFERERADRRRETELAVANALALATNAHDALQGILGSVCKHQGWACGAVWEVGVDGRMGCSEVWCGTDSAFPEFQAATRSMRFARGTGLPGRVWDSGAPAFVADVIRDTNFPRGPYAASGGLHSAIALPIRHEEKVVGAMEFLSKGIRDPDPELLAMMGAIGAHIGQVLETKRAQESLQRSEANLSDFFENATVGLHWIGPDGTILRANHAELEMLGYAAEEYVGRSIKEFHADPEVIDDILARLTAGEQLDDYQARMRC
jgi:GAF domain-containing protein